MTSSINWVTKAIIVNILHSIYKKKKMIFKNSLPTFISYMFSFILSKHLLSSLNIHVESNHLWLGIDSKNSDVKWTCITNCTLYWFTCKYKSSFEHIFMNPCVLYYSKQFTDTLYIRHWKNDMVFSLRNWYKISIRQSG